VGVQTLALEDPSRSAVGGTGPRPVTLEVYYPSTTDGVAGIPRDVVTLLGIPVVETLALNFFDGVLNGNAEALARLAPEVLSTVEDLRLESK